MWLGGSYLRDILKILLVGKMGVQGDGSRLDGDATFLFILSCVCKPAVKVLLCVR